MLRNFFAGALTIYILTAVSVIADATARTEHGIDRTGLPVAWNDDPVVITCYGPNGNFFFENLKVEAISPLSHPFSFSTENEVITIDEPFTIKAESLSLKDPLLTWNSCKSLSDSVRQLLEQIQKTNPQSLKPIQTSVKYTCARGVLMHAGCVDVINIE